MVTFAKLVDSYWTPSVVSSFDVDAFIVWYIAQDGAANRAFGDFYDLRDFGASEGLPDSSATNVFAVNRRISGEGMVGLPDLRLGTNLISDVTLGPKDGLTEQLRRWNVIRPNDTLIIRPDALGGSYVVPRSTIRPPTPTGGSGR